MQHPAKPIKFSVLLQAARAWVQVRALSCPLLGMPLLPCILPATRRLRGCLLPGCHQDPEPREARGCPAVGHRARTSGPRPLPEAPLPPARRRRRPRSSARQAARSGTRPARISASALSRRLRRGRPPSPRAPPAPPPAGTKARRGLLPPAVPPGQRARRPCAAAPGGPRGAGGGGRGVRTPPATAHLPPFRRAAVTYFRLPSET